ncbi:peroxiredoxin-like family protein [Leeuwenhoekiella parthenopeia]|uniref:AhpC/TSA family protein n=1 Tax=Leeuwenhoekiella parthenopeia TaxID=2890320 RepID=A0ABS8GST9_9FLAO|nr:peroxiredoxin-like family protein [Leeuwenhoekiella parthenopeia]MCC4213009.1 AhpC/TSA family protein [Leeuwenhoekiella parthenopeia]
MKPNQEVPQLDLNLINGTRWELSKQKPERFTLVLFYRGLHCPICKKQLKEFTSKLSDFEERGVNVIAVSMDSEKRAKLSAEKWETGNLPIAYELTEDKAREWGLYISHAIKEGEPKVFSEPGLFLINPDGTLYSSIIQTMPFARPDLDGLLKGIDFIKKEEYPARGGN